MLELLFQVFVIWFVIQFLVTFATATRHTLDYKTLKKTYERPDVTKNWDEEDK